MADDYLSFREMQGFNHDMNLAEAYRWQDEMARIMAPTMGGIAGYKAGGHDSGPGFPTFPPEGIRGIILEGMMRLSGTRVGHEQFRRVFLKAGFTMPVLFVQGAQDRYSVTSEVQKYTSEINAPIKNTMVIEGAATAGSGYARGFSPS
jgi:pimeloyl-ACP methyl ester carboxylesterase